MPERRLNILGTRGIPAAHGGFESFVARYAPYMKNNGWMVTVYCQGAEGQKRVSKRRDVWNGIERVHIDTYSRGALATVEFDLRSVIDVVRRPGVDLVLGYNTAVFNLIEKLLGRTVVMNMDGIEWKRSKWGRLAKTWFWLNEWIGSRLCDVPVADHPQIAAHLASRGCERAVVIPYGSDSIKDSPSSALAAINVETDRFFVTIARIEPENSILEIIRAFLGAVVDAKLLVLGKFEPNTNTYHATIAKAIKGSTSVVFPGGIYDPEVLAAIRTHCLGYVHGHQVGGTNPSLVEALGAGTPVIAHDNRFNRWTAGEGQLFFTDEAECAAAMRELATSPERRASASADSRKRHAEDFTFEKIHRAYEDLIERAASRRS
ncbi:DUF1972 domain-containing protein [Siculibacillus lacustris]|uniref:DUF1972 domain-containing protein n=2 Tax=Siculibacillus lacustris TaxID=1549641 RepID=A0A4Q9VE96_9HYPH|nr:DUF1972 domain-containing protein [Siculibacillus lacustris]